MFVEQYFAAQASEHQKKMLTVHRIILSCHPGIVSTIKYGVPFYVLRKNLCYLCIQKNRVILGVVEGHRLIEVQNLLDFTGRTQIGHFLIHEPDAVRYTDLQTVLQCAIEFDLRRKPKG